MHTYTWLYNTHSCFYEILENSPNSWKFGRTRKAASRNTRLQLMFPQHFLFSLTSTRVSITQKKHGTCFLVLQQNSQYPNLHKLTSWVHVIFDQVNDLVTDSANQTRNSLAITQNDRRTQNHQKQNTRVANGKKCTEKLLSNCDLEKFSLNVHSWIEI